MMKKLICLFIISFYTISFKGQVLLIDKTNDSYIINSQALSAKGKTCQVTNILNKEFIIMGSQSFRPFIVIKNFNSTADIKLEIKPARAISIDQFIKATVLPKLGADMLIRIENMESTFRGSNLNTFDSLIVYDGKTYWFEPGITIVEFFNLIGFEQKSVLQTNQTIFNINAKIPEIYSWTRDSLPVPNIDAMIWEKIFLLKKNGEEYTFYKHPYHCEDCSLNFYNEYVYRKEYGIIAFKSKYLSENKDKQMRKIMGKIIVSDEYYYFQ